MMRLIFCVTCIAAIALGCGEDSSGPNGGSGGAAGTGGSGGTGGSAGVGGEGGMGGSAGMGGTGGSTTLINGCLESQASDLTGMANVTITDIAAWLIPHSACVRVSTDTVVTWQGDFTIHPLAGGVTPTKDEASPISAINASSGSEDASVTLDMAGTYPYFCEIHLTTMQGVIYVE
ncbi:MAG: plastocyanin/azurin family copper-binding protein [Myxococcales bacterium]|nr:plastocyanin/azurin family copper-binding protein [Myxococcales bacterium]